MTREEAIKLCKEIRKYMCSGNPIWDVEKIHEAMTEAIVDMEMIPKYMDAAKLNWIPCSVRMPSEKEYGQVLITIFGTVEEATYDDISGTGKPIFYIGDFTGFSYTDVTKCVTAWMPKPKPYEGGNDEICRSE